jgi:hypothetical protein
VTSFIGGMRPFSSRVRYGDCEWMWHSEQAPSMDDWTLKPVARTMHPVVHGRGAAEEYDPERDQ